MPLGVYPLSIIHVAPRNSPGFFRRSGARASAPTLGIPGWQRSRHPRAVPSLTLNLEVAWGLEALKRLMRQRQRVRLLPAHAVRSHKAHIHHYPQPTTDDLLRFRPPQSRSSIDRNQVSPNSRAHVPPRRSTTCRLPTTVQRHQWSPHLQSLTRNLPYFEREHFDLAQAVCAKTTLPRSAVPLWDTRHW